MTRVVYKLRLSPGFGGYEIPKGATLLHAGWQHGAAMVWFLCDPEAPMEVRKLLLVGTGHVITEPRLKFVGTFLTEDQNFVFHVFEQVSEIHNLMEAIL